MGPPHITESTVFVAPEQVLYRYGHTEVARAQLESGGTVIVKRLQNGSRQQRAGRLEYEHAILLALAKAEVRNVPVALFCGEVGGGAAW